MVAFATLVAIKIFTLTSPRESNPSNWFKSSNMVRWISRSPPEFDSYRLVPIASISSATKKYLYLNETKTQFLGTNNETYKDNARCMLLRHPKQFANQFRTVAQVFLDQFRANNTQKGCRGLVCNRLGQQGFSRSRCPVQYDPFGGPYAHLFIVLRVGQGELHRLLDWKWPILVIYQFWNIKQPWSPESADPDPPHQHRSPGAPSPVS